MVNPGEVDATGTEDRGWAHGYGKQRVRAHEQMLSAELCQQLVASGSVLRMKGVVQLLDNADAEGLIEATEDGATESTWVLIEAVEDLLTFRRAHPPGARPRADAN